MPDERFVTVVLEPEPEIFPGLIVQVPVGKPVKATLPVVSTQVGWVIAPVVGAEGEAVTVAVTSNLVVLSQLPTV